MREKTVFDTSEVPHIWAKGTQNFGKNRQGNFCFNGDYLISYSTKIAKIYRQEKTLLITNFRYSNTTEKQVRLTELAFSHFNVIRVTDIYSIENSIYGKMINFINTFESLKKSKSRYEQNYLECRAILGDIDYLKNLYFDTEKEKIELFQDRKAKFETILSEFLAIDHEKKIAENHIKIVQQKEKSSEKIKALLSKGIIDWRAGENICYPYQAHMSKVYPQILRVKDGNTETSLGVKIDLPLGIVFAKYFLQGINLIGKKIDGYEITEKNQEFIKIGCHTIFKEEIENLVKEVEK